MPRAEMKVALVRHTLSPEETIALGARLCYSRATVDTLLERVSRQDQEDFVRRLMDMGHESVFEHASFTFAVEGVSRVLLAQITRHRLASFSVQSQRYVSYEKGFGYIIPPKIEALGEEAVAEYEAQMLKMHEWYTAWQERLGHGEGGNEDARFVLPGACETRMLVTMNARELRHFFSLRMCSRAQWEIRELATRMHRLVMDVAPVLFADAGPGCLRGKCPEGEKSCGKAAEIRSIRQAMLDEIKNAPQ
ncbi:MAG: FAD-dependent thymidylate synthase [Christensenellaceae bacterium]|nr:FAD-dependent thymidylate synthase [Christensenellaceae bacterium]